MVDAAIIGGLFTNLAPFIRDEFSLFLSFEDEVEKLSRILSLLDAALKVVETKNLCEKYDQMKVWLQTLNYVGYEVRDIMGECTFDEIRHQVERLNASYSTRIQVFNYIAHHFRNTRMRIKIGHKIKYIIKKLEHISSEFKMFQLPETIPGLKSETIKRETMSRPSVKVHGRDEDCKGIVEILVNSSNDDKRLSVFSIIGVGGLGKTTLAQMVFNDEKVNKHFDKRIWVCISRDFDINRVMRDIIGDKSEANLEQLRIKVISQLNEKRYLIVFDDVWNEDEIEWNHLRSVLEDCGSDGAVVLTTTRKKLVAEIMKSKQHFNLSPLSDDACWLLFKECAFRSKTSETSNLIDIGIEIAKKCKGVPLIAMTLGSHLGFKDNEEDWRRIRDNEIWETSRIENSISPILKLSYDDLPYHLRRCFAFCAIFAKGTKIEKERLIQLWMAHDLIPINNKGENDGNTIWDDLCWRSFFQDEKEAMNLSGTVQRTCKMHDLMHDLAQLIMKDECYTIDEKNSSEDFGREIRHVIVMIDQFTKTLINSFKKKRGLQSLILRRGILSKEILSVLKKLPSLRVLEVSIEFDIQSQDLCYVGCLKHLRYLDLSSCRVKTLPDSICDLLNLQTLNLNDCEHLESLPRNMKDLINLQHLYLNGCKSLIYMPGGMGRLKGLKTLSLVVVGKEINDCQLDEFKDLEIRGSLRINHLERVSDASIERGISMAKMSSINKLELQWENNHETNTRHEKIGEALEVSSTCLKILIMKGYQGVNIPKWMRESYASLMQLELRFMDNVEHIFPTNNMNTSVSCDDMRNLKELVSIPIPIPSINIGVFSNLSKIEIIRCPKLGALPPCLKSLKDVTVWDKCTDELFQSISDLSGQLTRLRLVEVTNKINVLFPAVATRPSNDMNGTETRTGAPLLEELGIHMMENLRELVSPLIPFTTTIGAFPNLEVIDIYECPNLGALPPHHLKSLKILSVWGECTDELLNSISNIRSLDTLYIGNMEERSVLFGGGGWNYYKANDKISSNTTLLSGQAQGHGGTASSIFQSLRSLFVVNSPKLSYLFDNKEEESFEKLARGGCLMNLQFLFILDCPELMISLEQWRNITHSLLIFRVERCPKLVPSKVEEAKEVIAILCSLRERLGNKFHGDILNKKDQSV